MFLVFSDPVRRLRICQPPNSIALQAHFATVVKDMHVLSAEYRLPLLAKTEPPCSAVYLR